MQALRTCRRRSRVGFLTLHEKGERKGRLTDRYKQESTGTADRCGCYFRFDHRDNGGSTPPGPLCDAAASFVGLGAIALEGAPIMLLAASWSAAISRAMLSGPRRRDRPALNRNPGGVSWFASHPS